MQKIQTYEKSTDAFIDGYFEFDLLHFQHIFSITQFRVD
jgi:hypothetical protein